MNVRAFQTAECCLNCQFRTRRIGKSVLCRQYQREEDGNVAWMPERGWCIIYKRTTSKAVLRAEQSLIDAMLEYVPV